MCTILPFLFMAEEITLPHKERVGYFEIES